MGFQRSSSERVNRSILDVSIARSLERSIARSLGRSNARSLDLSLDRSIACSLNCYECRASAIERLSVELDQSWAYECQT